MESIKKFPIKESIKESWKLFKSNFGILLQVTIVMAIIFVTASSLIELFSNNEIVYYSLNILSILLSSVLCIAYYFTLISVVDGKKVKWADLLKSVSINKTIKVFLNSLLVGLILIVPFAILSASYAITDFLYKQINTSIGLNPVESVIKITLAITTILYIIFAIFLSIKWQYSMVAIIDKDLGVVESLKYSWKVTKNNSGKLLLLQFVNLGIAILGLICLLIGLIPALIVICLLEVVVYRKLQQINNV